MKSPTTSPARQIALILILVSVLLAMAGCGDQMAQMEANQLQLQAMVAANARQLATISSQVHTGKGQVTQRLARIEESTGNINTKVLAVQSQQARLQDAVVHSEKKLGKEVAQVQHSQTLLTDGVSHIADISQKTSTTVAAVARDQAVLHEIVQDHKRELVGHITTLAKNQEQTHAGITNLQHVDQELADRVAAISQKQDALRRLAADNHEQVSGRIVTVAKNQEQTHAGLSNLHQADQDLAAKIAVASHEQQALQELTAGHHEQLTGQITALSSEQTNLRSDVGDLHSLTHTVAGDLTTVANEQAALRDTVASTAHTVAGKLAIVEENQNDIQSLIDLVANTAGKVSREVTTLAATQATLQKKQQARHEALEGQLVSVAENQHYANDNLDTITTTAVQLSLDVLSMGDAQAGIKQAVQNNRSESTAMMTSLAQGHQTMQGHLNEVTAATEQVALDVAGVDENQTELAQVVQANGAGFLAKLDGIAQDQQAWLTRVDTTKAKIDTMTASITSLEQRLTKLQATLQTSLVDIGTLLDAKTGERARFQEMVGQDMQGLALSVSELADVQAGLAEDVQQVQETQQSQTENILSVLQQLQQRTEATVTETSVGIETSKAEPREIMLP